jgi:hypothetical protein
MCAQLAVPSCIPFNPNELVSSLCSDLRLLECLIIVVSNIFNIVSWNVVLPSSTSLQVIPELHLDSKLASFPSFKPLCDDRQHD